MTQPKEYAAQMAEITDEAGRLAVEMETNQNMTRDELQRGMAQSIELWQRRVELLGKMIQEVSPDYISPFGDL